MSDPNLHDEEHERLLQEVLTGDRSPQDEEVRGLVARCSECAAALGEMLEVAGALDRDAREQRAARRPPPAGAPVAGADRVGPTLAALVDAEAPPTAKPRRVNGRPVRRLPPALLLPLAAAVVLAFLSRGWWTGEREEPGQGLPLGTPIRILEPVGEVESLGVFRWEADLPDGGWYTVRIWAAVPRPGDRPLLESPELTEEAWTLSDEERARLPDGIHWQVRMSDAAGVSAGADEADASRP